MAYDSAARATLLDLLARLGGTDDAAVLAAARSLHAAAEALDADWDELLVPAPAAAAPAELVEGDDAAVVAALLKRSDLMADTRDDLNGFLADIQAGRLSAEDRRYLHALNERLSRR